VASPQEASPGHNLCGGLYLPTPVWHQVRSRAEPHPLLSVLLPCGDSSPQFLPNFVGGVGVFVRFLGLINSSQ
jgi:hypothetical protein